MNYIIIGIQRSGNHAIINWLSKQIKGKVTHDNNLNIEAFLTGRLVPNDRSQRIHFRPSTTSIFSFENLTAQQILAINKRKYSDKETKVIIILRDCYNLFASIIKSGILYNIDHINTMWKEHARFVVCNHRAVLFSKWFSEAEYRKNICEELGIRYTDEGLNDVSEHGAGSSFDGVKYNGSAQQMNVLGRWMTCLGTQYDGFFDDESHELNEAIFGFNLKGRLING